MGSSNQFYVDCNATSPDTISLIIESGRKIEGNRGIHWDSFCFRKWSEKTKWDPTFLVKEMSAYMPTIIFSVKISGDWGSGKIFFLSGEEIEEKDVFPIPAFPTLAKLKTAIKKKKKRAMADRKLKEEKEKVAKAIAATQKKIKDLENELKELKSKSLAPVDWSEQHG